MAARSSCVFFAQGRCYKGASCLFSHDGEKPICVFYNSTGCNNGAACPFRHEGRPATPPAERWRQRQDEITRRVLERQAAQQAAEGGAGARRSGKEPRVGELQRALAACAERRRRDPPPPLFMIPRVAVQMETDEDAGE